MPTLRRTRAQSQALPPRNLGLSPQRLIPQTPSRRTLTNVPFNINTPPPHSLSVRQLKFNGSLTDPPQRRRRATFSTEVCVAFDFSAPL